MKIFIKKGLAVALSALFVLSGCSESPKRTQFTSVSDFEDTESDVNEGVKIISALNELDYNNIVVNFDADVTVEDALVEVLEANGVDTFDIYKAGINLRIGRNYDLFTADATGTVNGVGIASFNTIFNAASGDLYYSIPQLNDAAVRVSATPFTDDFDFSLFGKFQEEREDIIDILLNYNLDVIFEDYANAVVEAVGEPDDVYEDEIDAGDKSKFVTAKSYYMSASDYSRICNAILEKLKNDESIIRLVMLLIPEIADFSDIYGFDASPLLDAYLSDNFAEDVYVPAIDSLISEIQSSFESLEDVDTAFGEVVVFFDDGEFSGFELCELDSEISKKILGVYKVVNGDECTLEVTLPEENSSFVADGFVVNGKFSGKVAFKSEQESDFEFNFENLDLDKLACGIFDGSFIIDESCFNFEVPDEFRGYKLKIDVSNDVLTSLSSFKVYYENELLATLNLSYRLSDSGDYITMPENSIDAQDISALQNWIGNLSFERIFDNLELAGVNTDLLELLRSELDI